MPPWIIKAAVQGTLSRLPQPQKLNRLLQTYVTRSLELTQRHFLSKWEQAETHLAHYARVNGERIPADAVELGTGWYPVVPIGLALAGVRRVVSIDMQPLLSKSRIVQVLEKYNESIAAGRIRLPDPATTETVRLALERSRDMDGRQLLASLGVQTLLADAGRTGLPPDSVDLFVSNNTLEHIPGQVILGILTEFRRLGRQDSVSSQFIDMGDHYAGFDRRITVLNFLQYSERSWRWFNNRLQYQNRLRLPDFRRIHAQAGWRVIHEDNREEPLEALRRITLASQFKQYSEDEVRVFETWMVATPELASQTGVNL